MNIDSPNFVDGLILETKSTQSEVTVKLACSLVNSGEIELQISPSSKGRINVYIQGLGSSEFKLDHRYRNGFTVRLGAPQ